MWVRDVCYIKNHLSDYNKVVQAIAEMDVQISYRLYTKG